MGETLRSIGTGSGRRLRLALEQPRQGNDHLVAQHLLQSVGGAVRLDQVQDDLLALFREFLGPFEGSLQAAAGADPLAVGQQIVSRAARSALAPLGI